MLPAFQIRGGFCSSPSYFVSDFVYSYNKSKKRMIYISLDSLALFFSVKPSPIATTIPRIAKLAMNTLRSAIATPIIIIQKTVTEANSKNKRFSFFTLITP